MEENNFYHIKYMHLELSSQEVFGSSKLSKSKQLL